METVFELLKKLGLMVRPKRPIDSRVGLLGRAASPLRPAGVGGGGKGWVSGQRVFLR